MKRALFISITLVLIFAPGCKDDNKNDNKSNSRTPLSPPLSVKINISYEPPNITISAPDPDPAKIAKGETVNWVVTVTPGTPALDVTIDDFADSSGKRVDVFGDGSTYKISGAGSAAANKPSGSAVVVSEPEGFKYRITAVSASGDRSVLDPRIIVSAVLSH